MNHSSEVTPRIQHMGNRSPGRMNRWYRRAATALAASALLCATANAHNVWLLPSSTVLSQGEWVTVDAAVSNDLFFFNHVPLNVEGLVVAAPDGTAVPPRNLQRGQLRTVFDLELRQPGTYRIAVRNSALFASYKDAASGSPKRWRGSVDRMAAEIPANAQNLLVTQSEGLIETFVTVGKPSNPQPTGQGLELVALTHPNDLVKGEPATFVLQVDGKPAAGLKVEVIAGASRYRNDAGDIKATTDSKGQFSVTWPAAGMYWLSASSTDDRTTVPQARQRRLSYAVTLEVLP